MATALRGSRWVYPALNASHILGIALLYGGIVPMDLRLIGLWRRDIPLESVLRLLQPIAAGGAAVAIITGGLLFTVQARDYAALPLLAVKLALVTGGLGHALWLAPRLATAGAAAQRRAGLFSIVLWTIVIGCGRMIGYV